MNEFVMKREVNYWWERTLVIMGKPLIMFLVNTSITPNMITLCNMLIVIPMVCIASWKQKFYVLALLVQLYMFFDILDGNLARNKNMKTELGRKLDIWSDTLFYTVGYFFIGLGLQEPIWTILFFILIQQVYGGVATYYIVPNIRKLDKFEHTKLKNIFIQKGPSKY